MHHFDEPVDSAADNAPDGTPWYRSLSRYHWFVFVVAALGWRWAFPLLALGPAAGIWSIRRLVAVRRAAASGDR